MDCIKPLYYINKLFGLSYLENGFLYIFELFYAFFVILISFSCLVLSEAHVFTHDHQYFEIKNAILLFSFHIFTISPIFIVIVFRFRSNDLKNLIRSIDYFFDARLRLSKSEFRRISYSGLSLYFSYAIFLLLTTLGDLQTNFPSTIPAREQVCIFLNHVVLTFPVLQFVCLVLLLKFVFGKSTRLVQKTILHLRSQTCGLSGKYLFTNPLFCHVRKSLDMVKDTLELKYKLLRLYGFFVIVFKCHTVTGVLFHAFQLVHEFKQLNLFFAVLRFSYFVAILYFIYWVCESTFYQVSCIHSAHQTILFNSWFENDRVTH